MSRTSAIIVKGKPKTEGPRTYPTFGVMRGGTTMIAGVMRGLGVHMGDRLDENNQESADFNGPSAPEMRAAIERTNETHEVWGWKYPNLVDYIDQVWPSLRAPHLICVFRDSVANGRGLNRWHPIGQFQAAQTNLVRLQMNLNLMAVRGCPSILISYEKAINHRAQFIEEFAALLGRDPAASEFDLEAFMAPESYKNIADHRREGAAQAEQGREGAAQAEQGRAGAAQAGVDSGAGARDNG